MSVDLPTKERWKFARCLTHQNSVPTRSRLASGAGEGNRTLVSGLGSPHSTIEPHPQCTDVLNPLVRVWQRNLSLSFCPSNPAFLLSAHTCPMCGLTRVGRA